MFFLDTFPSALSEYIYSLYGYKLILTSNVGLKIRVNAKFLQFLHFFPFLALPREAVKHLFNSCI